MDMSTNAEESEGDESVERSRENEVHEMIKQGRRQLDPKQVEELLVRELNEMSLDQRERVMQEMHGVAGSSLTIEQEDKYLKEMQIELDVLERNALVEKTSNETDTVKPKSIPDIGAYRKSKLLGSELIQDRHFRWKFLHREDYNPKKAALRMIRYLDFIFNSFFEKEEILLRPIFLEDLHPLARKWLNSKEGSGVAMVLPVRDPAGRRVLIHLRDPDSASADRFRDYLTQAFIYLSQCVTDDRKGAVWVYFLHNSNAENFKWDMLSIGGNVLENTPTRFDAVHICYPDLPIYKFCMSVLMLFLGKENRIRRFLHTGSYEECKYSLLLAGIFVDRMPRNLEKWKWSYDSDLKQFRKWLAQRECQEAEIRAKLAERERNENENSGSNDSTKVSVLPGVMDVVHSVRSQYIECAHHEDCMFGKGNSVMNHPGNKAMRRLVEQLHDSFYATKSFSKKQEISWSVLHEIQKGGGRFLKEDPSTPGLYVNAHNEEALKKVSVAFRDLTKKKKQMMKQQTKIIDSLGSPDEPPTSAATTFGLTRKTNRVNNDTGACAPIFCRNRAHCLSLGDDCERRMLTGNQGSRSSAPDV